MPNVLNPREESWAGALWCGEATEARRWCLSELFDGLYGHGEQEAGNRQIWF
jgi:hypothetical protein